MGRATTLGLILAAVVISAGAGWFAGTRIKSPAQVAAETEPPQRRSAGVADRGDHAAARLFGEIDRLGEAGLGQVRGEDGGAFLGEAQHRRTADAARRARDDRALALEPAHRKCG